MLKKHQVSHHGIGPRVSECVARRSDKKNFSTFSVKGRIKFYPCDLFNVITEKIDHILECMGLNPQMVTCPEAICRRFKYPVYIQAEQGQKLSGHHGNFRGIDAVGTVYRTPPALRTLVKI